MNLHELTPENQAILKYVRLDYFWQHIPFERLRTALDVGGHIGSWSHVCREYAPHMQITAIEPHGDCYRQFVQNVPDVPVLHAWVGYRENVTGLCCREQWGGSHYVLEQGRDLAEGGYILPLPQRVTLEDFGQIDLLKLDCEGSEFDILLNCEDAILHRIQVIVGEYHLEHGSLAELVTRLQDCGFDVTTIPHGEAPHLGHFMAKRGA